MTNYRVYISGKDMIGESLIQANSGNEAADVYVQTILDNGISVSPYVLSNDTLVRIDSQKPQSLPGKVTFDYTGSMKLSEIDSWKQYGKTTLAA